MKSKEKNKLITPQGYFNIADLRLYRKRLGLTQYEMSKAIGVKPLTYFNYEQGNNTPLLKTYFKIVIFLREELKKVKEVKKI